VKQLFTRKPTDAKVSAQQQCMYEGGEGS